MAKTRPDNSATIHRHLDAQIELAEWLQRAATPNGATLVGAEPQLTMLAMALATHVCRLRTIRALM